MAAKKKRGRKPSAASKSGQIRDLLKQGMKPMDIAKKVKCTPALVYNVRTAMAGGRKAAKKRAGAKRATAAPADGLGAIMAAVQSSERDRKAMRDALLKIQALVNSALG